MPPKGGWVGGIGLGWGIKEKKNTTEKESWEEEGVDPFPFPPKSEGGYDNRTYEEAVVAGGIGA